MLETLVLKATVGFVVGFGTGVGLDLQKFRTYKKREQWVEFDWRVAVVSWFSGGFYGTLSTLGLTGAQSLGVIPD
jgi:hypothetical protein